MSTRWFDERSEREREDYALRFVQLAEQGNDIDGESRLIDAMSARGSRILDAGCGTGRVGWGLQQAGHEVVAVDADPVLIAAGQQQHPGLDLRVSDLSELAAGAAELGSFDLIVCTGNVMVFLEPGSEPVVLAGLDAVLRSGGRAVFGFHTDRDYSVEQFDADAAGVGWTLEHRFGTWDLAPYDASSDWATSVFRKPA